MDPKDVTRKLSAILSADVQGYSRLMGDDEIATVETITEYRETFVSLVTQWKGRVVDSPGDNILAEFASVVDAVQCAVEIQNLLKAKNEDLPENRRMIFRIGVNLGDVIQEGDRIYGDGVNIAARIEGLADGGGICISGTAYDHIENKLALGYNFIGEHSVKNIAKPVRVYKVPMDPKDVGKKKVGKSWKKIAIAAAVFLILAGALAFWNFYLRSDVEPASVEKMAFPLPEKPSIAVLAFDNLSEDPKQEYFSDGLTEEIITTLSKVSELFVVARNSTFTYKGKPVRVRQVAEDLGVRYVLEGSVRKGKDRIRITAQLIDALTGHHLWAEHYDRELKDILAVQDEITKEIIMALEVKLTKGEQARVFGRGTDNVEAWALGAKAMKFSWKPRKENMAKARDLLQRAIQLDSDYAFLWSSLSHTHFLDARMAWTKAPAESIKRATECVKKALTLDPEDPFAHMLMATIYLFQKQHEKAISEGQRAISLDPNYADGYALLSQIMRYSGRFDEALALIEKGMRLCPTPPFLYTVTLAHAYLMLERYEEALSVSRELLDRCKRGDCAPWVGHRTLSLAYMGLGREEDAKAEVEELLRLDPTNSLEKFRKMNPYKEPVHLERLVGALRKAGLPETPPLPLPDKPSIAVLPFTNMSDDPEQEYFTDGMTDDLITDLSKISGLFVIARNSVFTYKGKSVKVQQVGRDLGVRYILEGTVRRADKQVRINAKLIDAKTGGHLWAERYDGKMDNIFTLQDKITEKIVTALAVKLTPSEQEQVTRKDTDNIEAYDAFLKGWGHYLRWNREDFAKAIFYFKKAIELDPNYGRAYAALGNIYWFAPAGLLDIAQWDEARNIALKYLQLAMKNPTPYAHGLAAQVNLFLRLHKEAISEAERALALAPNDPYLHGMMATVLNYAGRPKEAIEFAEFEMRHDPRQIYWSLYFLGVAHFSMGKLEQAATYFERSLKHNPDFTFAIPFLAATYAHLGRNQEAQDAFKEASKRMLSLSDLRSFMVLYPFKDMEVADRYAEGLLRAGVKGQTSGYYKIYEENRLTGKGLRELVLGTDSTKWWIEGDMLCIKKWKWLSGCYPLFRNPEGTPDGKDEYLLTHGAGSFPFSTIPRVKEEAVEAPDMKWIKWVSDADGFGKDGIFTRKNPPAFSFEYPADFIKQKLSRGTIFVICSPDRLPLMGFRVLKITGDVNESLQGFAEKFKKEVGKRGTDIKIIYNKPLHPDTYGESYPAYEYLIEWKWQGKFELTMYCNVIAKEGYFISMFSSFRRAVDRAEAEAKAIFKTIDLKP